MHSCNVAFLCVFRSDFYRAMIVFVSTCSLLFCFHPKPSFLMHEGYILWVVKLHILKQILNCIMLKHLCILHHLQLYDITGHDFEMICIMLSHLFFYDVINDTCILHKLIFA